MTAQLVASAGNEGGAAETITELQGMGVRLGIITNVPAGWDIDDLRAILAEPEFLDEFEVVILSSEAGGGSAAPLRDQRVEVRQRRFLRVRDVLEQRPGCRDS